MLVRLGFWELRLGLGSGQDSPVASEHRGKSNSEQRPVLRWPGED